MNNTYVEAGLVDLFQTRDETIELAVRPANCGVCRLGDGSGLPVVFLHGWLMGPYIWTQVCAHLPRDRPYLALWQPSHGASGPAPADFSLAAWANWLEQALDRLGAAECVLVGHSMGGILALEMLRARASRVAGLALIAAPSQEWSEAEGQAMRDAAAQLPLIWSSEMAAALASMLFGHAFLRSNPHFIERWMNEVATYDLASMPDLPNAYTTRDSHLPLIEDFGRPVSVIHGMNDTAIPIEASRATAQAGDDADLVEIEDAGHCPPLEAPRATARAVIDLLDRVGGN